MQKDFILVKQLTIKFGSVRVLQDISLSIDQSEVVAIIGANGCGKTTLLKTLAGILPPSSGKVRINAWDYANQQQGLDIKRILGYAPDTPPLYPYDTINSYLRFIAELKQIPANERSSAINNCLEVLGLTSKQNAYIHSLSHGFRQRVNLAQALLNTPRVLILDEPTNGLDPEHNHALISQLKVLRAQHGTTIILTSHQHAAIVPLCDYMLKLTSTGLQKILLPVTPTRQELYNHDHIYSTT